MSLKKDIENGESKNIEFKIELPSSNILAKTVIAFSNTGGGKLIIGISDKGEIIGLKESVDIFELQDKIASIVYETCYPNILPDIYTTTINGAVLLVIEIFRGNLLPYYLKHQGKNDGVYIRVGATNRKASYENIIELERQRFNKGFDQEINKSILFENLDISAISKRFKDIGKDFDQTVMKNLKLIYEENGKIYPTNGLLILLGMFEHVIIKCSRFKGVTMDVFLDRKEYKNDLFTQLENAENFIKNHISLSSEIKGLQREDKYEIPIQAIREALVNAVIHRDYSNFGRDVKIGVYDDMVNIVSPGGFPSTITQEDILEGRSEIRNKVIARVFKELNYIEQWGSGIRRIKSSCKNVGLLEPDIIEKGDFVDVSLYRGLLSINSKNGGFSDLNEQESKIIDFLNTRDGKIKTKDVKNILNVEERRAREVLKGLVDRQFIIKKGKGPSTFYELK